MSLRELRSQFHNKTLEIRSIDRLIDTYKFEDAYKLANDQQKEEIALILKLHSCALIKKWIRDILSGPIRYWSYRRLREAAKNENIHRYSRLDRDDLIAALEAKYATSMG